MEKQNEKIIRDPVHDVIAFRLDRPVDALLFRLVNADEFQRLRRIRQLGMASLAYPGADHSRYSHSLGVLETARRMLGHLREVTAIDEEQETLCLCAALLHDLGHGPFSHVFERVTGLDHEKLTIRVLLDDVSAVHQTLIGHDRQLPEKLAAFMRGEPRRTFLHDVISSQLDADRFDYLLRDNLMTGSRYGDYDLRWLLHSLTVESGSARLAVSRKGISAVEDYLQSRYHMYRNVYFHKVVRSAEGMVKLALQRARRLAVQGRLEWPGREHSVYKALLGQRLSIEEFVDLDDVSILHCFKLWTKAHDPVLARLCEGLLFRRLFKTIDVTGSALEVVEVARAAVAAAGGDGGYDLFSDEPIDTPYEEHYNPMEGSGGGDILVTDASGAVKRLTELSPMPAALNRQLMFRRLHVAEQWVGVVRTAIWNGKDVASGS